MMRHLRQMKRFFPTSLALRLVIGSLGHVIAAAFCPPMFGHQCCLAKTSGDSHPAKSHQHMHSMRMDGMSSESMEMNDGDMQDVVVDDTEVSPRSIIDDATGRST